jgi:hypothetical protein
VPWPFFCCSRMDRSAEPLPPLTAMPSRANASLVNPTEPLMSGPRASPSPTPSSPAAARAAQAPPRRWVPPLKVTLVIDTCASPARPASMNFPGVSSAPRTGFLMLTRSRPSTPALIRGDCCSSSSVWARPSMVEGRVGPTLTSGNPDICSVTLPSRTETLGTVVHSGPSSGGSKVTFARSRSGTPLLHRAVHSHGGVLEGFRQLNAQRSLIQPALVQRQPQLELGVAHLLHEVCRLHRHGACGASFATASVSA